MQLFQPLTSFDRLSPGDHICGLTLSVEEYKGLLSRVILGELEKGNRVVYLMDGSSGSNSISACGLDEPPYQQALHTNQFVIVNGSELASSSSTYNPDKMISFLEKGIEAAGDRPGLRIVQDMGAILQHAASAENLMEYESRLNGWIKKNNCAMVCLFDRQRIDAEKILMALFTHPKVILGSQIHNNFYYVPPRDMTGVTPAEVTVDQWMDNLETWKNTWNELHKAHGQMERRVQERTNELREANIVLQQEITERKRIEDILRRQALTFENMFDAVILTDLSGAIIEWNPAATRMFGYSKEEVLGLSPAVIHTLEDRSTLQKQIIEHVLQHGRWTGEVNYITKDGVEGVCEAIVVAVYGETGTNVVATVGVNRDISHRKIAEQILGRRAEELEALYKTSLEITAQLDLPTLLNAIIRRATALIDAPMGAIYLLTQDKQALELVINHNLPGDFRGTVLNLGDGVSGRVALTGEPMMVEDYSNWEGRGAPYRSTPFKRVYGVPLMVRDEVIGVINVTDTLTTEPYTPDQMRMVKLFADQAAIAVANARLYEAAQKELEVRRSVESAERQQRLLAEALADVAEALNSTLDFDEVLDRIVGNVGRLVPHDSATILMIEGYLARVVRRYDRQGVPGKSLMLDLPVEETESLRRMYSMGEPMCIPDTWNSRTWKTYEGFEWIRSYAGAPIRIKGKTVGFLNVDSTVPGFYTQKHAEILQAFADQAGIAIENARLFKDSQKRSHQLSLINDITRAAISDPDTTHMLRSLPNQIARLFENAVIFIDLWDPDRQLTIPVGASGEMIDKFSKFSFAPGETTITSQVLSTGKPIVFHSSGTETESMPKLMKMYPARSLLTYPLIADNKKLGAIIIGYKEPHNFAQNEISLADQVADQIALAIAKTQSLEAEKKQTTQLIRSNNLITALGHVAARIESAPDPDGVMDTLGVELRKLGVDCLIFQVEDNLKEITLRYMTITPAHLKKMEKLTGTKAVGFKIKLLPGSVFDTVARSHQGMFLDNSMDIAHSFLHKWPESVEKTITRMAGVNDKQKVICLPMMIADKLTGYLIMWGYDIQGTDLPAATVFTSQVAIALENARLYAEVQKQAITDELTGLYNRRGLFEFGNREVERAHRFQRPLSALMLDIDHFKLVNDEYGHQAGDVVLETLAKRCRKNIRGIDIPGRYGGEEFVFLLVEDDKKEAERVAERLRACFSNVPVPTGAGDISITVSIGVAEATPETQDLAALVAKADVALYQAKKAGRNCVRVYTKDN